MLQSAPVFTQEVGPFFSRHSREFFPHSVRSRSLPPLRTRRQYINAGWDHALQVRVGGKDALSQRGLLAGRVVAGGGSNGKNWGRSLAALASWGRSLAVLASWGRSFAVLASWGRSFAVLAFRLGGGGAGGRGAADLALALGLGARGGGWGWGGRRRRRAAGATTSAILEASSETIPRTR